MMRLVGRWIVGVVLGLGGCTAPPIAEVDGGVSSDGMPFEGADRGASDDMRVHDMGVRDMVGGALTSAAGWQALATAWVEALHAYEVRCRAGESHEDYRSRTYAQLVASVGAAALRGEVVLDEAAAARCFAAIRAEQDCAAEAPAACREMVRPQVAEGGACVVSEACGPDAFCQLDGPCSGVCRPRAQVGEPCNFMDGAAACAEGARCDGGLCRAAVAAGAGCLLGSVCGSGMTCVEARCAPTATRERHGEGERCSRAGRSEAMPGLRDGEFFTYMGPRCGEGLACAALGGGGCVRPTGDESCREHGVCPVGQWCDRPGEAGRCLRIVESGGECGDSGTRCRQSLTCSAGRCRYPAPDGLPCSGDEECPTSACVGGVCRGEGWCGRRIPSRQGCEEAADCAGAGPWLPVCLDGVCHFEPQGVRLHLTNPQSAQVPEVADWLEGWADADGWLLNIDGGERWFGPAVAPASPHPVLPASRLGSGRVFVGIPNEAIADLVFSPEPGEVLWRPGEDRCRWAPSPISVGGIRFQSSVPEPIGGLLVMVLRVERGSGLMLAGEPVDRLFEARGLRGEGDWLLELWWSSTPVEAVGAPADGRRVESVDLCAGP